VADLSRGETTGGGWWCWVADGRKNPEHWLEQQQVLLPV